MPDTPTMTKNSCTIALLIPVQVLKIRQITALGGFRMPMSKVDALIWQTQNGLYNGLLIVIELPGSRHASVSNYCAK